MSKKVSKQTKAKNRKVSSKAPSTAWSAWRDSLSPGQRKVGKGLLILAIILITPIVAVNIWFTGDAIFGQISARTNIKDHMLDRDLLGMEFLYSHASGGTKILGGSDPSVTNVFKKPDGKSNQEIMDAIEKEAIASGWTEVKVSKSSVSDSVRLEAERLVNGKYLQLEIFVSSDVSVKVEQ